MSRRSGGPLKRVTQLAAMLAPAMALLLAEGAAAQTNPPAPAPRAAQAAETVSNAAALRVKALAATCAACHGTDGHAVADPAIPGLAGRPAAELIEQLRAFKSGTRTGTVMPQLAKGYDDAQLQALAAYFEAQGVNRVPRPTALAQAPAPHTPSGQPHGAHP